MNLKLTCSLFGIFCTVCAFPQDQPEPKGYKLRPSGNIVFVYRNVADSPDFSKANHWSHVYWFMVDRTPAGMKIVNNPNDAIHNGTYIRVTIPSERRYSDNDKVWLEGTDRLGYNSVVDWKAEDNIDGSDFNTWLWIRKNDFDSLQVPYYGRKLRGKFMFSGLTVPFKYRPTNSAQPNSLIGGSFNLGGMIGYRFNGFLDPNVSVSFGGHLGVSSMAMTAATNSAITGSSSETTQGFTYGVGVVVDLKNQFQLGAVAGWDNATGNLAKSYFYQNKSWFSFSLNYNFLSSSKQADTNDANTKSKNGGAKSGRN